MLKWGASEWATAGQWAGAIATFFAAIVSLRIATKSNKPSVKVQIIMGIFTEGTQAGKTQIIIRGINNGIVPITLTSSGMILPKKIFQFKKTGTFIFSEQFQALPRLLNSSDSTYYSIQPEVLSKHLVERGLKGKKTLKFVYGDSIGNTYIGKFKFDIDEWSN